ncbi:MAG: hypothetical protein OEV84_04540 [Betaproteobacteria bacterium]|nr:hypothetical protein [Betaproteobacteria bacterium]
MAFHSLQGLVGTRYSSRIRPDACLRIGNLPGHYAAVMVISRTVTR